MMKVHQLLMMVTLTFAQTTTDLSQVTDPLAVGFIAAVRGCHHGGESTAALSSCLMAEINGYKHQLGPGIPALNIPRLEPLVIDSIPFNQTNPPVTVLALFTDVHVTGGTDFDLKYLEIDVGATRKVALGLTIPRLYLLGRYTITGNIIGLPIQGSGDFESILDGIIAEGTGTLAEVGGQLTLVDVKIGFKIRDMDTTLHNLFEGNQLLSDTMHHFLKENSQLVLDEVRPEVTKLLNIFIKQLFNGVLSVLPKEALELKNIQQ